jgi:transitional endoplasmic reticulum ATPase
MKKKQRNPSFSEVPINRTVRLWLLRLLVTLEGYRQFITSDGIQNFELAKAIDIDHWADPIEFDFDHLSARKELKRIHLAVEKSQRRNDLPACLKDNVIRLSSLVSLSDVECRILEFGVMLKAVRPLQTAADFLGSLSCSHVFKALAVILGLEEDQIRKAFAPSSTLIRSGLLKLENYDSELTAKLELLSDDFADNMVSTDTDPADLIRGSVFPSCEPHLTIDDYGHAVDALSILRPYLARSMIDQRKGVNIFLYGKPGTGKTQLAKVLAQELQSQLFEIASENHEGVSIDGEGRLRAYCTAQCFFAGRRAILLFDEVEDVFADGNGLLGQQSTAQKRKAWMNRTLEQNAIPTIWVSNSCDLDPAFVRRFDMVFELQIPPQNQREEITRKACLGLLSEGAIARVSQPETLAPALITRAASVVGSIHHELGESNAGPAVEFLVSSILKAQGHTPIRAHTSLAQTEAYDPAFIHADADLEQLRIGIIQAKAGRLCLYGPPGTGKTAFAHWLTKQADTRLIVRRGSDLMSPYVGLNEQNIANAFGEAEREKATLLIDEADSFLQDRRSAQQSWQISLVNEMLIQIETFPGIFIASTNRMDGLDTAVLRRFDMKVRFDFLRPDQAWGLMIRYCSLLNLPTPSKNLRTELCRLTNLTPGDFAVVDRQRQLNQIDSAEAILSVLKRECSFKSEEPTRIGFL